VGYATLMGLTGKDLVSIGGKLDRLKVSAEIKRNIKTVDSTYNFLLVGKDTDIDRRWKIKTDIGSYTFERQGYGHFRISSSISGISRTHSLNSDYAVGRIGHYKRDRYSMMLDVYNGVFRLDF
jgi:hypothetical protein